MIAAGVRARDDGGHALGEQTGEQHARLDLRAGDGQLVADPVQVTAGDRERRAGCPPVASIWAPISRSGTAIRSTGRWRIEASPSSVKLPPGCAREPGRQQAHQRPRVADVDRAARVGDPAQAGAADHDLVRAALDDRAERSTASSVESVSAASR